jgi:hypothetical protein
MFAKLIGMIWRGSNWCDDRLLTEDATEDAKAASDDDGAIRDSNKF